MLYCSVVRVPRELAQCCGAGVSASPPGTAVKEDFPEEDEKMGKSTWEEAWRCGEQLHESGWERDKTGRWLEGVGILCEGHREPERGFTKSEGHTVRFLSEKALRWQGGAWVRRREAQWSSHVAVHLNQGNFGQADACQGPAPETCCKWSGLGFEMLKFLLPNSMCS